MPISKKTNSRIKFTQSSIKYVLEPGWPFILTECPFRQGCKVGSLTCSKCNYFVKCDPNNCIVTCKNGIRI